jgi:hypothetical protein
MRSKVRSIHSSQQDRTGVEIQAACRQGGPSSLISKLARFATACWRNIPSSRLKMIGYMNVNKRPMAVIQVEDKVKQVKVGDYIGLDFGMVTQISDTEVQLRELIQDSAGDWTSARVRSICRARREARNEIHQLRAGRTAWCALHWQPLPVRPDSSLRTQSRRSMLRSKGTKSRCGSI